MTARPPEGIPPVIEMGEKPSDIFTARRVGFQSLGLGSREERSALGDDIPRRGCKGMADLR